MRHYWKGFMGLGKNTKAAAQPFEPMRVWNRKFIVLIAIDLIVIVGTFMVRPIVAAYAVELGATLAIAGVVSGMSWFIATILRPATGYFADRLNKKTSFLIATIASALSAFGCALSDSIVVVGIFTAVGGVAMSFQAIALTSLVALCVPRSRVGTGVGWMGIVMNVSMAIGPVAAANVAVLGGYRLSFAVGGILCTVGMIMLVFFKAPLGAEGIKGKTEHAQEQVGEGSRSRVADILSQAFHGPTVIIAIAAFLVVWSGNALSTLLFTVEGMGYLTHATIYYVLYAVLGMASRPLAGWLSDRVRSSIVAVPLILVGACGMIALVFGHDLTAVVVCGTCMGLGQASAISVVMAESVRGVDPEHLGRATNTYFMGVDISGALATWVGGILIQVGTPALMFGFNAFTCVAAAILIVAICISRKRKLHQRESH